MSDTTETVWSVDGVSLQTYAYNITSLGNDRKSPPPLRGDNILVPYRPGSVWVPRVPDSKVITLGMWVQGSDEDGKQTTEGARRTFDRNWNKLRDLFWVYDRELVLTKRFWVLTSKLFGQTGMAIKTEGQWSLIEATTKAAFRSGLEPDMMGPAHSAFTVDLLLGDPFFYSADPVTLDFTTATGGANPGPNKTFNVLGEALTTDIVLTFDGPLISPKFTISSYTRQPWIQYQTDIAAGDDVVIGVKNWVASHTVSGAPHPSAGYVRHFGAAPWLWLNPGSATVKLTAQSGTGFGSLTYTPAWL
jgi:hypothetical protein